MIFFSVMTWRRKDTTNQIETFKVVLSSPAPGWVESSWWASPGGCLWWSCSSPPGGAAPPRCWQGQVWGDFVTGWLGSGWEALTTVVQPDGDGEEDPKSDSHQSSCHVVADRPQADLGSSRNISTARFYTCFDEVAKPQQKASLAIHAWNVW